MLDFDLMCEVLYTLYRFPPTAATVSSSLILGICGLPDTIFRVSSGLSGSHSIYQPNSVSELLYFNNSCCRMLWKWLWLILNVTALKFLMKDYLVLPLRYFLFSIML